MTFEFDDARNGNVALTGELNLSKTREFTVCLAFGETLLNVVSTLFQALGSPYKERRQVFMCQWQAANGRVALEKASGDRGHLFDASYNLLLSHEDKVYQGAFVGSLSISMGKRPQRREWQRRLPPGLDARFGRNRDGTAGCRKYGCATPCINLPGGATGGGW